jgi:hypothetical protein
MAPSKYTCYTNNSHSQLLISQAREKRNLRDTWSEGDEVKRHNQEDQERIPDVKTSREPHIASGSFPIDSN